MNNKILIIGFVWPEPQSSAAGHRMLQLITFFKERNYDITFATTASITEFSEKLLGINIKNIELNSTTFDLFVSDLNPFMVLFDRFMTEEQFGWRVADSCPNAIRILDSEDLHFLREARRNEIQKKIELNFNSDLAKREIASIYRCDLTLVISEYELFLLENHFNIPLYLLLYLPIWVKEFKTDLPLFETRKDFIFIGNFLHAPNHDAVLYLKDYIWPLIFKKLPDIKLHVYGAYMTEKIKNCHNPKTNFYVHGRAECVETLFLSSRLLIAPLRFGAGIKGKLLESMQYGTPTITTSIGAEGMFGEFDWNGVIEDSPEQFAKKAIALYRQKKDWLIAQQNGFSLIKNRYSKINFDSSFENTINDLSCNFRLYREKNFIGMMLMYHSMRSTKYMSKWIEAKNINP